MHINGSKIEGAGFRYNYPELRIEFLREVSAPTLQRASVSCATANAAADISVSKQRIFALSKVIRSRTDKIDEPHFRVRIEGFSFSLRLLLITRHADEVRNS